jgi:radical SAM superfamily enzyme with C-terminal helix-hairpin-helix motif
MSVKSFFVIKKYTNYSKILIFEMETNQGYQTSWFGQGTPDFWTFLLTKNLLISGADFHGFLLIFPDF